jgi:hypothetical protein
MLNSTIGSSGDDCRAHTSGRSPTPQRRERRRGENHGVEPAPWRDGEGPTSRSCDRRRSMSVARTGLTDRACELASGRGLAVINPVGWLEDSVCGAIGVVRRPGYQ